MEISKIDKNFANGAIDSNGMRQYGIPCEPFELYGVFHDGEKFLRIPEDVAKQTSEGVVWLNTHTSGGRVRFSTNSQKIGITVTYNALTNMPHMPLSGQSGFVLIDETDENNHRFAGGYFPEHTSENGFSICKSVASGNKMRDYILYMPLYNDVKSLTVVLDENAVVKGGKQYNKKKPVLYYGSSITQGGCASRPDTCYPALICKWSNTDYINLGFSGNAKAERAMAEYLSGIECSIFVCDYDHNAPNAAYLEKTHFALYRTFREKQPNTPIIFISKPDCEYDKQGKERCEIIQKTVNTAKENGDTNVYFIKGYDLYGDNDRELCAVDSAHPTDHGFFLMAKKIYSVLKDL